MAKALIILGILLTIIGVFYSFNPSIPFLGKLPGDITLKGDSYQIYFPIVSCIVISVILSLLMYLFSK